MPTSSNVSIYEGFAKKEGLVPDEVELVGGARGFWIGDKSLQYVFVYFVGESASACGLIAELLTRNSLQAADMSFPSRPVI